MSGFIEVDTLASGRIQFRIRDLLGNEVVVRGFETVVPLGPYGWMIYHGHTEQFKIVDYHFSDDYEVETDNGTVNVENDIITYTPALVGLGGFRVNGHFYPTTVLENRPVKPAVLYPSEQLSVPDPSFVFLGSMYDAATEAMVHESSLWQVALDAEFTNIVFETNSSTDLTSLQSQGLEYGQTYYVRIRHVGDDLSS